MSYHQEHVDKIMGRQAQMHVPFDQLAYQELRLRSQQTLPRCQTGAGSAILTAPDSTGNRYPVFPPPQKIGFIYPSMEKESVYSLLGEDRGPTTEAKPFIEEFEQATDASDLKKKASSNPDNPTLDDIINHDDTPQPAQALPGTCHGSLPYDATMTANSIGNIYPSQYNDVEQTSVTTTPPNAYREYMTQQGTATQQQRDVRTDPHQPPTLLQGVSNSVRGIMYDLGHYEELPVHECKLWWILTRDDRPYYLLVLAALLVLIYYVLKGVLIQIFPDQKNVNTSMMIVIFVIIAYFMTPPSKTCESEIQKMLLFAVIAIVSIMILTGKVGL